jgi:RNA polymerase sigma-70 factor (ECF subfamily)
VTEQAAHATRLAEDLLELYPSALPQVYGFLLARCSDASLAEDLTAETFMDAVAAIRKDSLETITVGWLIVVARRRLIDHWRRLEREQRTLRLIHQSDEIDPWDEVIDVESAREALGRVAAHYRAALTLRYLDGMSVPEVAGMLDRTVHATESLLARARLALRDAYEEEQT